MNVEGWRGRGRLKKNELTVRQYMREMDMSDEMKSDTGDEKRRDLRRFQMNWVKGRKKKNSFYILVTYLYVCSLQKEYEAMKLVNLFDKMVSDGVMKPARIGPDGRPQPVEHVLELRENAPNRPQS
jgi:hypothetical protein